MQLVKLTIKTEEISASALIQPHRIKEIWHYAGR